MMEKSYFPPSSSLLSIKASPSSSSSSSSSTHNTHKLSSSSLSSIASSDTLTLTASSTLVNLDSPTIVNLSSYPLSSFPSSSLSVSSLLSSLDDDEVSSPFFPTTTTKESDKEEKNERRKKSSFLAASVVQLKEKTLASSALSSLAVMAREKQEQQKENWEEGKRCKQQQKLPCLLRWRRRTRITNHLLLPLFLLSFTIMTLLTISLSVNGYPLDPIEEEEEHPRLQLISWRWEEVEGYFIVSVFLLTAALVKVAYHQIQALHMYLPESCVLIVLGTAVGLITHFADITEHIPQFSSSIFFFLLLPPIILESSYSLYDKTFFNNISTVALYAVVGTLLNVFFVGSSLFLVERMGWFGRADIPLVECFTFSTLISAVDPVAVLAIFQELGVNKALYFLVFGESLFNDAVVITLYNMVTTFAVSRVISTYDVVIGILNFITVSGGGLLIGLLTGAMTAMVTKITSEVRVVEPLIVVALAYFSYVAAELFHFSGIISLIACGLVQSEYVKDNISKRSFTTIKYFTKTLSSIADVIIFFFLGRVLIREDHVWVSILCLLSHLLLDQDNL